MLRHTVAKSAQTLRISSLVGRRAFTAGKSDGAKRALSKQQLKGIKPTPEKSATPPPATPDAAAAPPPPPPADGDSGNMLAAGIVALALTAGGAYYYNNMEPDEAVEAAAAKDEPKDAPAEKAEKPVETSIKAADGSNRVVQIEIPMKEGTRSASQAAAVSHPEGGNKVTMESTFQQKPSASVAVKVKDSLKELQASIEQESSAVTARANEEVMKSFDESLFSKLDDLSASQLKAKVVQLATEMKERTKWEALRLKEFLAMKEKETADKYLGAMQTQRLEFESILARRLMEQEHELTTQANAKLQEKDAAVKELVDLAISKLGEEHENEKVALRALIDQEMMVKYEQEFMRKVEEVQMNVVNEMGRKEQALEALNKKVEDLEASLASTQGFHEDSLQAHKLSAAALALAEKMESNQGAGIELGALKVVAGRDGVVATALESVPASVANGVPTLNELQARFDKVASKTRQAALVPAGQSGVEGQLAGMLFAALKFPPKPDDPSPVDDKDAAEYVIVRARQHVQLGELEKAIHQLDKLQGQAAFTVQGWKKDATDRVAVEQALKVIKMECALLNESMSKAP